MAVAKDEGSPGQIQQKENKDDWQNGTGLGKGLSCNRNLALLFGYDPTL